MNDAPNEFQPLMDEIYRGKVLRARERAPGEKFVDGLDLFEEAVARMRCGIRAQFPHFSDAEVDGELRRRINRVRQVQEFGFYSPVSPA